MFNWDTIKIPTCICQQTLEEFNCIQGESSQGKQKTAKSLGVLMAFKP